MEFPNFRFAVVISHPIQHYSPLFRALAQVPGLHVKVFYLCDHGVRESFDPGFGQSFAWDVPLLDGYEYEFLRPGFSPERFGFLETDSPDLIKRIEDFKPHAMWIHGYGQRISWRALKWARGKTAIIYFGDSELLHGRSILARAAKYFILRYFFDRCDAFLTIGDNNERYYLHYGVPADKLFRGACPVDVGRFLTRLSQSDRPTGLSIRKRLGIPENELVAIISGKLIPIKRQIDLIKAISLLRKEGISYFALLIGDGPSRKEIENCAEQYGVADRVKITGFINQKDIPFFIEAGDIAVMTSEKDPHPLAVTESLILGLPVVASDKVGCVGHTDTARPGVNALVYPCGDINALAEALALLARDTSLRARMGRASLDIASTQDVTVAARAVVKILLSLRGQFIRQWSDLDDSLFRCLDEYLLPAKLT